MMNFLTLKQFSPKRLLKGDNYVEKETDSIHNALFLPVTIVSSFVYYAAHTDIENKILFYLARLHLSFAKTLSTNSTELSVQVELMVRQLERRSSTTSVERKTTSCAQTRRSH